MSTSADVTVNGNGSADHDHILRPRAVKPGNPAVLRAQSEEGLLAVVPENGNSSGQTRYGLSSSGP
jgi:sterol O-acyltransferase